MKIGKCVALTVAMALSAAIIAGCNNKPSTEANKITTSPIPPSQPLNLPATATPEQRATAQAQDQANRAAGAAMFNMMQQERLKNIKK